MTRYQGSRITTASLSNSLNVCMVTSMSTSIDVPPAGTDGNGSSRDSARDTRSSAERMSPRMTPRTLTALLCLMALVPPITIGILWNILPPVAEGKLECEISASSLPDPSIYRLPLRDRPPVKGGLLVIRNSSNEDWTHINIWVNGHYQIYDLLPLKAGEVREYALDRFVTRFGAAYDLRYNPLASSLVYARMPEGHRATRKHVFPAPQIPGSPE